MLFNTIVSFLKIGVIGFGGGSALIPVVEDEIVNKKKYIDEDRFTEHTIVANITPGALPVKLGCLSGYDMSKNSGMLAGAFSVAIPGVFITILLLSLLSLLGENAVNQIELASVGISAFIIFLLIEYIIKVFKDCNKQDFLSPAIGILIFSTLVTFGKELREMLKILIGENAFTTGIPFFDISTIELLYIAFFIIFFTGGKIKSIRMYTALVISAFSIFVFGKGDVFSLAIYRNYFMLGMFILMVMGATYDVKNEAVKHKIGIDYKTLAKKLLVFLGFTIICCIPAILIIPNALDFIASGAISTATSFGGGEAYITVADGMFVATGVIEPSVFYGQIVPIANALPGPILIKVLSGIGYILGFQSGGVISGYLLAIAGFSVAISVSCGICLVVDTIYHSFSELQVFITLKRWILPFICGLLVSTMISMFVEQLKTSTSSGVGIGVSLVFISILTVVVVGLCHKLHLNSVLVIILMGAISVGFLNLM